MARPTHWQRGFVEGADGFSVANYHAAPLDVYEDGETITRVRFRYQAIHVPSIAPAEGSGLGVAIGLQLLDELEDPAQHLFPADNPSQDWLWWEFPFFVPTSVEYQDGVLQELDQAPLYDSYRDCKTQRKVVGSQILWLVSQNSALAHSQTSHYLSVSYSTLVIDAP